MLPTEGVDSSPLALYLARTLMASRASRQPDFPLPAGSAQPAPALDPRLLEFHDASWQAYMDLANAAECLNQPGRAIEHLERALEQCPWFDPTDPRIARTMNMLAVAYWRQGRRDEAVPFFAQAAAACEVSAPDSADLALILTNLANAHSEAGRLLDAEAAGARALAVASGALGEQDAELGFILDLLGQVYAAQGRRTAAVIAYRRALAVKEAALGPADWGVAVTLGKLGDFYLEDGRYLDAEDVLTRALAIKQSVVGQDDPSLIPDLRRLANVYLTERKYLEAESLFRRALEMLETAMPTRRAELVSIMRSLADAYRKEGRFSDARKLLEVCMAILERAVKPDDPENQLTLEFYSEILRVLQLDMNKERERLQDPFS